MLSWSTACPDWERRIVARESLVPFDPLFPDEAAAALEIFNNLRIVDVPGRPTMAEACLPWAFDLPRHVFGSYDAHSGRRLIRYFFQSVAKKNIKSTGAAGVMLTALLRNWRESGEFYILAPTKEIADNSFFPARDMVLADPALRTLLHVQPNFRAITHRNTGAFLKVIAADSETVGGKKTIGLLIDELWLFGKRANASVMIREAMGGLASHPEGFVIYLTTQGDTKPTGVFASEIEDFRAIRDGKVTDPERLAIIYEFPAAMLKSGEYRNEENWYVPNPNLGKSVDLQFLRSQRTKALRDGPSELINFEAKHLNVQVGIALRSNGWAGAPLWPRGLDRALTLDELLDRSEVVCVGLDGGGLDDLLGVAVLGRERVTKRWLAWGHALVSTVGCVRRKANAEDYLKFRREGTLTVFRFGHEEAAEIEPESALASLLADVPPADPAAPQPPDIVYVVGLVKRISERGLLAQVGVDACGIGGIVDALGEIGVTQDAELLDPVRQGIALMGAIKTVERKLADGSFRHGESALMDWCVGNLVVVPTPTAMRLARDESGFGKIDPAAALFNAAHLMSLNPEAAGSVYEERGLLVF